jgi:hypothetical protein
MIHPGLAALKKWEPIEYAAGYRARLAAIPDSEIAHHFWRCGWEDADTEALGLDRHKRVWPTAEKMITQRHGAFCSMPAAMPGRDCRQTRSNQVVEVHFRVARNSVGNSQLES